MTAAREARRPPRRLPAEKRAGRLDEHDVVVTVGIHPETLAACEVFLNANAKAGSSLEALLGDGGVLISSLSRHESAGRLAAALGRDGHIADPAVPAPPASLLGMAVEIAARVEAEWREKLGASTSPSGGEAP